MTNKPVIRESQPDDFAAIEALYPLAFPDEDLLPLVSELLDEASDVLSLVAITEEFVDGHIIFTTCAVEGSDRPVALLGPLAVSPARQQQGIGTALVQAGLRQLKEAGVEKTLVLGDPAYYGRFGFRTENNIAAPYPLPDEWNAAWQSLGLRNASSEFEGKLAVPGPWQKLELWRE